MSPQTISVRLLRQIPIYANLNETECRQLADICRVVQFAPGETILSQGEQYRNLWVVLHGTCEVVRRLDASRADSEQVALAVLEPYSHFGEMSFFHPAPHSADVRARTAVELLKIEHADYQDLIDEGITAAYKLAFNVVRELAERLRRMDDWVAELIAGNAATDQNLPEWAAFREKLFNRWNL
jgi:CRP-like cAMP-binding protein